MNLRNLPFRALALLLACLAPLLARAAELVVSPWADFREASVRMLVEPPKAGATMLHGAFEIRMIPGFKTYWRNAGDSGVPPVFDLSATGWIGRVETRFPFPQRFDDGAGGTAFGYVERAILPFEAIVTGPIGGPIRAKLDFAVCGTMCIPLSGEISFDPAGAAKAKPAERAALEEAKARVPRKLSADAAMAAVTIMRDPRSDKTRWQLTFANPGNTAEFQLFPEAKGYLQPEKAKALPDGRMRVVLTGEPAPGASGAFGIARLTFGDGRNVHEADVDLDLNRVAP